MMMLVVVHMMVTMVVVVVVSAWVHDVCVVQVPGQVLHHVHLLVEGHP